MTFQKYILDEQVEVFCDHIFNEERIRDWQIGKVVEVDNRMVAIKFSTGVYSSNGYKIPDQILWCTHGSQNIRRPSFDAD